MLAIRGAIGALLLVSTSTSLAQNVFTASSLPFNITANTTENTANYTAPYFPIGPFTKYAGNPILSPNPAANFESAYLYNPTAIVLNETIFLLYRAQNESKTSTIGLAWSTDGYNFTRLDRPILYPTEPWEQIGGCEDPRIVRVNSTFYMTYTAFDSSSAQLCMAQSEDLLEWRKQPPLFPNLLECLVLDLITPNLYGAIFNEPIGGLYHMAHGDSTLYHATSPDMKNWTTRPADDFWATSILPWENRLIESGPAPTRTRDGKWILVYNGMTTGSAGYHQNQYSVGQMLFDPSGSFRPNISVPEGTYQPALRDGPIARVENPLIVPESADEQEGQVDQVVFAEGLVQYKGRWFLYYGAGDSQLAVATAEVQP